MTPFMNNRHETISPPDYIDGAKVLQWAWSGHYPFGLVNLHEVYGLAICQYENSTTFYRFSCNKNWETLQDCPYDSIKEAVEQLPEQYCRVIANWQLK